MSQIDIADAVHHAPSGENWVIARVDGEHVYPAGWPCERARLADCTVIKKATDQQRADMIASLRKMPASDPRHISEPLPATEAAPQYGWAYDEEGPFRGGSPSADAAALEGLDSSDADGVYVGERQDVDLADLIDEDGLIETMVCRAGDEVGEVADGWLDNIKQADRDALKAAILPIVRAWVDARDPISFWRVTNVRYIRRDEVAEAEQFNDDAQEVTHG